MKRLSLTFLLIGCFPICVSAQAENSEEVTFFTADQVELAGTFYPGAKGAKSPSVILLHQLKGSRGDKGWRDLAESLQKKGFAVLAFDFRGHGDSTTVGRDYWAFPAHSAIKGAAIDRTQISYKDFTIIAHFGSLVNDIAAAKHFLGLKAKEKECDASSVTVIGADDGATLGALWVAAEWQRGRAARDASGKSVKQGQEGHDIACAIWLTINPQLIGRPIPLEAWLGSPVRERVPTVFLYGTEDNKTAEAMKKLKDKLLIAGKDKMHDLSGFTPIEGTGLVGNELLGPNLVNLIGQYIENVQRRRRRVVRSNADVDMVPPIIQPERFGVR